MNTTNRFHFLALSGLIIFATALVIAMSAVVAGYSKVEEPRHAADPYELAQD